MAQDSNNNTNKVNIAVIASQLIDIKDNVKDIRQKLESDYITRQEFAPIQKLVYGVVGLILVSVVGAVLALVLTKH